MDILTTASNSYMTTFSGYVSQFLEWGQWVFFSLLVINVVWMALWHAFDRHSFSESMPDFIKKFFVITLFYTIMVNHGWLIDVFKTFQFMGSQLTQTKVDPSSIISEGIGIANKIIAPVMGKNLFTAGFGMIVVTFVYLIVLFVFITIALDLALTLILTSALIAISTFLLGFAALGATSQIARQTLDVILANCVKLLGLYLVVAAGSKTMLAVTNTIPTDLKTFDAYAWIVAVAVLFWLLAKNLPNQLAKIVTGAFQETRGTDPAAMAISAIHMAQHAAPALKVAAAGAGGTAKIAGSMVNSAASHFTNSASKTGMAAVGGSLADLAKATGGSVADRFKDVANKLAGGPGTQQPISSVTERMYKAAQDRRSKPPAPSSKEPKQ